MAVSVSDIWPVAHLPLMLGLLRKLEVAAVTDKLLPPRRSAAGRGGRHPSRGDRHADLFHQRSAAGGRPATAELRPRDPGGVGAVRASSHLSVVQPFRADPWRGWDRCRSSDMLFGSVKGGDVF